MGLMHGIALAASMSTGNVSLAQIEVQYWDCDFASIHGAFDFVDAERCSNVYELLKAKKFNSDFNRFLEWWRLNKAREHSMRADSPRHRGAD